MRNIKTNQIKKVIDKIYIGDFDSNDIGMLFIWLRPNLNNHSTLLDLANFVAHSDERDRGVSFDHIHKFVKNIIEVSEKGGTLFGLQSVFKKEKVIEDLITQLDSLGLDIDKSKLMSQKDKIIDCLLNLMEEAEFCFKDARVAKCFLKRDGQKMLFCLNLDLKGPRIIMSPKATITSNLFG